MAILVCGDTKLEKVPGYWVIDCSAAVQNLLLAAHALGLGAVDGRLSATRAGGRIPPFVRPAKERDAA